MSDFLLHSICCLQTYLDRGEKALRSLKNGDVDGALIVLKLRKAAFHNFRIADYRLKNSSNYKKYLEELSPIWIQIQKLDKKLVDEIEISKKDMDKERVTLKTVKCKLSQFKSKSPVENNFLNEA